MELPQLKELGLTEGQIKVYTSVLEMGVSGVQKIQEKTALERRAIYDILNKLIEKGLISYTEEKENRKYQCTHPRILKETIKDKQKSLSDLYAKIPDITQLYNYNRPSIRAEVYRGNAAMRTLLEEALDYPATYWIGGNSGVEQCSEEMRLWFKRWTKKRVEQKKRMYDLVDFGTFLEDFPPKDIKKHKVNYYKYCQLPKNLSSPMVIIIFGNKVVQVLWSKQSFGFVIDSKEIRESFMKYFNYFWKEPY